MKEEELSFFLSGFENFEFFCQDFEPWYTWFDACPALALYPGEEPESHSSSVTFVALSIYILSVLSGHYAYNSCTGF